MNLDKCLTQARNLASKAKPFILKHEGKTYTAVFNQSEWVYDVFEDMEFLMKINLKQASKAKQFLLYYLTH